MSIKKPSAVESPYVTIDTTPTRLAARPVAGGGVSTVASVPTEIVSNVSSANLEAYNANVSYYANGVEGINSLATYGRIFAGANVNITLEEQKYITYNQNFTGNGTVGGTNGQIQFNNNGLFAGSAALTFDGANVVVEGIKTNNFYYANGQPFTGGGGTPGGANTQIQFNNAGNFGGSNFLTFNTASRLLTVAGNIESQNILVSNITTTQNIFGNTGTFYGDQFGDGAIYVGSPAGTVLGSDVVMQVTANSGSYSQINFQNINSGNLASGDYILTADNGSDSTYYLDLGLASSNHADPDFFGDTSTKNDGYLYVTGNAQTGPGGGVGNLILGSTNGVIKMFVGNTAQANVVATFASNTINLGFGNTTWAFDNSGNLTLPDDTSFQNFGPGSSEWHAGANGYVSLASNNGNTYMWVDNNGAYIATNWIPGSYTWTFGNTGVFTAPGAINVGDMSIGTVPGDITANANTGVTLNVSGPDGGFAVNYLDEVGNANTSGGELAFSSETGNATYRISLSDDLGDGFATKIWRFDGTGNFNLPSGGNIVGITANNSGHIQWVGNSSGDGNGYTTLNLVPDNTLTGNDQYLIIDPTAPGHIHIRAGGTQDNSSADLFLGGENSYFKVNAGANNEVRISANSHAWVFGADSVLTLPGEGILRSIGDVVTLQSYNVGTGNVNSVYLGSGGGLGFFDQDIGGNWLEIFRSGAEPQIRVPVGLGNLNIQTAQGNTAYDWVFDNTGKLTMPGPAQLAVYANTTVRDSSITSPTPGMMIYVTGTGMQVRGATSWNTIAGSGT